MISFSTLRPFLPYLAIAVLAGAALLQIQSLKSENSALQSQLGQKTQKVVALQESLRVVNRYQAESGAMRELWAVANEPSTDTLSGPESAEGRVSRRIEATAKTEQDTLSGASIAEAESDSSEYVHEIRGNGYAGTLWVRPPGDRLRYSVRLRPRTEDVSLIQTVDEQGVARTYLDAPSQLSVESLSAQGASVAAGRQEARPPWFLSWGISGGVGARGRRFFREATVDLSGGVRVRGAKVISTVSAGVASGPFGVRPTSELSLSIRW